MTTKSHLEIITLYGIGQRSQENAWTELQKNLASLGESITKEDFYEWLNIGEVQYMEKYYANETNAKTRKGKWKFRTYLPKAYISAKSTIGSALEHGLQVEAAMFPKTELAKRVKKQKAIHQGTTSWDKVLYHGGKLTSYWDDITEEQQQIMLNNLKLMGVIK
jgi:hypothetical protein